MPPPPLLLLSFTVYCWAHYHMVKNIPLVSLGQLSWLCPFPTSCPPPGLWSRVGETVLMLWEHCSALAKSSVCYQHCSNYKCKAQHREGCCGERQPHPSQTQCTFVAVYIWEPILILSNVRLFNLLKLLNSTDILQIHILTMGKESCWALFPAPIGR